MEAKDFLSAHAAIQKEITNNPAPTNPQFTEPPKTPPPTKSFKFGVLLGYFFDLIIKSTILFLAVYFLGSKFGIETLTFFESMIAALVVSILVEKTNFWNLFKK